MAAATLAPSTTEQLNLDELLTAAHVAADAASRLIADRRGRHSTVECKTAQRSDIVTDVDVAAEQLIREALGQLTPDIPVVGEEQGGPAAGHGTVWTADPIDGTVNFTIGSPHCGPMLALLHDGRPVLSVIDLPFLGERYHAVAGAGAYRNDTQIAVAQTSRMDQAVMLIEDHQAHAAERQHRLSFDLYQRSRAIRTFGASCAMYSTLATGGAGGYVAHKNCPWDVMPGKLLVTEAGGTVLGLDGREHTLGSDGVIAAAPGLRDELVALAA